MYLGIDAGGTHTDAVLIRDGRVECAAKVPTDHENLPASVAAVLAALPARELRAVRRVTLGTTLAVNALVQDKADAVGLALSAGPGMAAGRAGLGAYVAVVPGGLDHRGMEVTRLDTAELQKTARRWHEQGVGAFAAVSKFSPRNPAHEQGMAAVLSPYGPVTQGHSLSGQLNFPRRVAAAWLNSAVWRIHNAFLDAVEESLLGAGIHAPVRLLKADGGAMPLELSRRQPVESILSGPAASVMGVMALCDLRGDSILLDMGGTTTDIALYATGSPVLDRDGMRIFCAGQDRRTPVRALASRSLGVGGDSLLRVGEGQVFVGPQRLGPAMAFGGTRPTLLDALNVQGGQRGQGAGQVELSRRGVEELARAHGMDARALALEAAHTAVRQVAQGVHDLLRRVNEHPVYTLAALLEDRRVEPQGVWLVGGPAELMRGLLEEALALPVTVPQSAAVANAVGAALTLPTAQLELFADTTQGVMRVPELDICRDIPRKFTLQEAQAEALELLGQHRGGEDALQEAEIVEAEVFATLDDRGYGGKDMRVRCQLAPGIAGRVEGHAGGLC